MTKEEAAKLVDYWTKKQIKDHGFKRGQLDNLKTQYGEDVYDKVERAYKVLTGELKESEETLEIVKKGGKYYLYRNGKEYAGPTSNSWDLHELLRDFDNRATFNIKKDIRVVDEDTTTVDAGTAKVPAPLGAPGSVLKRKLPKMFEEAGEKNIQESWQNEKLPEFLDRKEAEVWIKMSGSPKKYDIKEVKHYSYKLQANRTFYQIVEK